MKPLGHSLTLHNAAVVECLLDRQPRSYRASSRPSSSRDAEFFCAWTTTSLGTPSTLRVEY